MAPCAARFGRSVRLFFETELGEWTVLKNKRIDVTDAKHLFLTSGSVIWLVFVGIVMGSGTPYVREINTSQGIVVLLYAQNHSNFEEKKLTFGLLNKDAQTAQTNAFSAAGLWIVTFLFALGMWRYRLMKESELRNRITNDNTMDVDLSAPLVVNTEEQSRASKRGSKKGKSDRESETSGGSSSLTTI